MAEKSDWAGRADGVLSKDFVIHKDYAITGIVSHEMGHCLNLYHTHELQFGRELPNGSNCQTAGDLICDTPADPNLNSHHSKLDSNCNTTQPINDNNGVTEQNGWEWEVDYSYVRPSDTQSILIYPRVFGPIYARVRRENQCGKGPWLTEYFEVIQSGGHKILR